MLQSAEFSTTPPISASIANTTSHTQETSGTKDGVNKRSVSLILTATTTTHSPHTTQQIGH